MSDKLNFNSIVFAGGGCRCFWQLGFWETASAALNFRPDVVAGTSAGAAMACLIFSDKTKECMHYFKLATGRNKKNFYPLNLFNSTPAFPQHRMYRDVLLEVMDDNALKKINDGPEIRVTIARAPSLLGPRSATVSGLLTYLIEKKIKNSVHPGYTTNLGFKSEIIKLSACNSAEEITDLIIQSSCTPPFVPVQYRGGDVALDGGLVDNVPVHAIDESEGGTLVLLTRNYPVEKIPDIPGRVYVQPSKPSPVSKWDYTDPKGVQKVYDMGRMDGEKFANGF